MRRSLSIFILGMLFDVLMWSMAFSSPPVNTSVSGTNIQDANGNQYVNGTISAFIVLQTGQPLPSGASLSSGPFNLDATASFSISLFSPASYVFTVCGTPVNLGPRGNPTPNSICFTTGPIPISGGSQDITATLNASANILGPKGSTTGGGSPGGTVGQSQINDPGSPGNFGGTGCQTFPDKFVGPINQDCDTHSKGPNPVFDIMRYGGYFESFVSPTTATGSINSGSSTLLLGSAQNFANGQGIVVPGAGLTPVARNASYPTVPTVGTVVPLGVINGATTYSYQFVTEDYFGGLTAAGTQGSTIVGAPTLGTNTFSTTSVARTGGVDTFTCGANCNVATNTLVQISGFAQPTVNGTVVVATTPDATHFTVNAQGQPDYSESAAGTVSVRACNAVIPSGLITAESVVLRTWIYRNGTRVGVSPGQDPFYVDCNQGATAPSYVPASAPVAAQAGYLATTISSGGGTTTLQLANAAGTTVAGVTVQHDNSQPLLAVWAAANASHGGLIRIPIVPGGSNVTFPFNATTDFTTVSNPQSASNKLQLAAVTLNQPWILPNFSEIEGIPQSQTSFQYSPIGTVSGPSQPLFLANHRTLGGVTISKIKFSANGIGASDIVLDQTISSGGEVGFIFNDNGYSSTNASAIVIKGGFDFWFTHGVCSVLGTENGQWFAHPCMYSTNASAYLNATGGQVSGRIKMYDMNFTGGTAFQQDNQPSMLQNGIFVTGQLNLTASGILHENFVGPTFRIAIGLGTSQAFGTGLDLSDIVTSDSVNGLHQPLVEMTGTTGFSSITLKNNKTAGAQSMLNGGGSGAQTLCVNNNFRGCGQTSNQIINGVYSTNDGGIVGAINGGSIGYLMSTPAAPASCVVSAGGSVPVTTGLLYTIVATDRSPVTITNPQAGLTIVGPACSVNTTIGNQTVTVTRPALPAGATGWLAWRGTNLAALAEVNTSCTIPFPITQLTYVDTFSFTCGTSQPQQTSAFTSGINSGGMNTGKLSYGIQQAVGQTPTITGTGACGTITTQVGGSSAGIFTCTGATGAATVTITPGSTAPNGWVCRSADVTAGVTGAQNQSTTTSCRVTYATVTTNDVLNFELTSF